MYTKGEWKRSKKQYQLNPETKLNLGIYVEHGKIKNYICKVHYEKDAQLIASAPELLKACKLMLHAINECDMEVGTFTRTEEEITNIAYKAINKAEGV